MAGAKETPRQKMVGMMYLVFVAMLAMNMSKEVLSAFGLMNEKFEASNTASLEHNKSALEGVRSKATEQPEQYGGAKIIAEEVSKLTDEFYNYVGSLKEFVLEGAAKGEDGKYLYENMDKGDKVDEGWFIGQDYSPKGKEIMDTFAKYRDDMKAILGKDEKYKSKLAPYVAALDKEFDLSDVKANDGATKLYLDYHYKGFPSIASATKLSAMQYEIKNIEQDIFAALVGSTAQAAASMSNYQAIVISEKSAYFPGEKFQGKVVLGRYDQSTVPTSVKIDGRQLNLKESMKDGAVNLNFSTPSVGDHEIKGEFVFMEDGKPISIPVKGNYVVVNRPNSATISADKMNVVYRGVSNPMTISFAGIAANKVSASAPGLKQKGGSNYEMYPGSGKEVTVVVNGKLEDGSTVTDKKTFRIKNIPSPSGTVRGEFAAKGSKSGLDNVTIAAKLVDFDFDLKISVTQFNIKVPGQPTIVVKGNKLDGRAKDAVKRASTGDLIVISEIKTRLDNAPDLMLPATSPATYEIN